MAKNQFLHYQVNVSVILIVVSIQVQNFAILGGDLNEFLFSTIEKTGNMVQKDLIPLVILKDFCLSFLEMPDF